MDLFIESCYSQLSQMNTEDLSCFVLHSLIPDLRSPASLCRDGFLANTVILVDVLNIIQNYDFRCVIRIATLFDRFKVTIPLGVEAPISRGDKVDECVKIFQRIATLSPTTTFILIAGDRLETEAVNMISRPLPRRKNLLLMNIVGKGGQRMEADDYLLLYLKGVFGIKAGFLSGDRFRGFKRSLRRHDRLSIQFSIDNRGIAEFTFIPFTNGVALIDPMIGRDPKSIPAMCYDLAIIRNELMHGDLSLLSQVSLRNHIASARSEPSRLRFFTSLVTLLGYKISLCIPSYPLSVEYTQIYREILMEFRYITDGVNAKFRNALEMALSQENKRIGDMIEERPPKRNKRE